MKFSDNRMSALETYSAVLAQSLKEQVEGLYIEELLPSLLTVGLGGTGLLTIEGEAVPVVVGVHNGLYMMLTMVDEDLPVQPMEAGAIDMTGFEEVFTRYEEAMAVEVAMAAYVNDEASALEVTTLLRSIKLSNLEKQLLRAELPVNILEIWSTNSDN